MPASLPAARLSVFALIVLITCACAPRGNVRAPQPAPDPMVLANRQLTSGNYLAAANAYSALAAGASGQEAARLRALAALAQQDAGDDAAAAAIIEQIGADATGDPLIAIAQACQLNVNGAYAESYALLRDVDGARLTPYQRGRHARCLGAAALATDRIPQAAAALTDAYRYPWPAAQTDAFVETTWRAVSRLSAAQLRPLADGAPGVATGWYALALVAQESLFDTARFIDDSEAWSLDYPQHPAAALLETLVERSEAIAVRPRKVALLLPFGDGLGAAANAIRDGFVSAWYLDKRTGSRPEVIVISSTGAGADKAVDDALAAGAEFIVGPLRKERVEALRSDADLSVNVLALNVTDQASAGSRPGFYQFGLTPEDEAREVARRARGQGERALILAPDTPWGQRIAAAYGDNWRELGAEVVTRILFEEDPQAYAAAVKQALNISASEARNAALRAALNLPLHFEPRRREDVDVILLAGFPDNARQILPQLRYFNAQAIPVYSTSHVYAGAGTAGRDPDLDGITFSDMPWLFGAADSESYNAVRRGFGARAGNLMRLYGLGIDAYRVLPYLAKMRFQQGLRVPGVTGSLWMDQHGVVHRQMSFARFVDGQPELDTGTRPRFER